MTRIITKTFATRALFTATVLGLSPVAVAPAQASDLSECYNYIMSACEDSISEYGQCIGDGFGLCDNQHPEPLVAGQLDLSFLPANQRRVVLQILDERRVPHRPRPGSDDNETDRGGDDGHDDGGRDDGGRDDAGASRG